MFVMNNNDMSDGVIMFAIILILGIAILMYIIIETIKSNKMSKETFKMLKAFLEEEIDLSTKIQIISRSLEHSANSLIDVQKELQERISFVENLKEQAKEAENIAALNQEQRDSINAMLHQLLASNSKKEGRRNFLQGLLLGLIFFILGVLYGNLIL